MTANDQTAPNGTLPMASIDAASEKKPCRCAELEARLFTLELALQQVVKSQKEAAEAKPAATETPASTEAPKAEPEKKDSSEPPKEPGIARASTTIAPDGTVQKRRIRYIQITYNDNDEEVEKEVTDGTAADTVEEKASKEKDYMFTVKRNPTQKKMSITIEDPCLRNLVTLASRHLRTNVSDDYSHFSTPFADFIYCWENLEDLAALNEESAIVKDLHKKIASTTSDSATHGAGLKDLFHFKDSAKLSKTASYLMDMLKEIKATQVMKPYFSGQANPHAGSKKVMWPWIWSLFTPGELLYYKHPEDPKMNQIMFGRWEDQLEVLLDDTDSCYWVRCWTYDWNPDGRNFKLVSVSVPIDRFPEFKSITELRIFPLKFLEENEQDAIKSAYIERGQKFHDICQNNNLFYYDGYVRPRGIGFRHDKSSQDDSFDETNSVMIRAESLKSILSVRKERVMVDFESFSQFCPTAESFIPMGDLDLGYSVPYTSKSARENKDLVKNQRVDYHLCAPHSNHNPWTDEQFFLLPGRVVGYQLKIKKWCELLLENLQSIPGEENKNDLAFDQLQLEKNAKKIIKDLIQSHKTRAQRGPYQLMSDFVKNKGDGLIILLHGEPGTGKTFTAESIATATGRPLYPIGPADIGTDPVTIERKLESHFSLASRWQAIMLFDEADVFLEARRGNDTSLNRNASVSVLLRVLEYYDGILMLTTNRIKSIDSAILSRVTIAILYQKLEDRARKSIFKSFVKQIRDPGSQTRLNNWLENDQWESKFSRFPLADLNGRQIRNVLMSTASLAQEKHNGSVQIDDLHEILDIVLRFQRQSKLWADDAAKKSGLEDA